MERGHGLLEEIETAIRDSVLHAVVPGYLEPAEHPSCYEDVEFDR